MKYQMTKIEADDELMRTNLCALLAALEARDPITCIHQKKVSGYGAILACAAKFSFDQIEIVRCAGLVHDIGKIGVPDHILFKQDTLTQGETECIRNHVDIGVHILSQISSLGILLPAVLGHHERYDGKGYPLGLAGDEISIEARCLCVVDAFDAITSDRPYRKRKSILFALDELDRLSGKQFDPALAHCFIKIWSEPLYADELNEIAARQLDFST